VDDSFFLLGKSVLSDAFVTTNMGRLMCHNPALSHVNGAHDLSELTAHRQLSCKVLYTNQTLVPLLINGFMSLNNFRSFKKSLNSH
jgi:hypothetical protein